MRKTVIAILGFICCLALMAATAMAQYGSSASNTQNNSKAKGTKLTGCLSGPNDENAYMLKTKAGKSVEVGGTDELKGHVGHEVTLTGEWAPSGASIGENEKAEHEHGAAGNEAAEKGEKGEKGEAAHRHFKVTSIKHVSDTCTTK